MEYTPMQKITLVVQRLKRIRDWKHLRFSINKHLVLLFLIATLFFSSLAISQQRPDVYAANLATCAWHTVLPGDTLDYISRDYRTNLWSISQANRIYNINLIFSGQRLCIPLAGGNRTGGGGLSSRGYVSWYNYTALQWSSRAQVIGQIRQIAVRYGLPSRLLLAIGWQESGFNQHVISHDGGIGTMQIMPYTAMGLNVQSRAAFNPYRTWDNIELGAIYLHSLWRGFHGNLVRVISAYNEGGWAVQHRGIYNWRYVNNVLALMNHF